MIFPIVCFDEYVVNKEWLGEGEKTYSEILMWLAGIWYLWKEVGVIY